MMNVRRAVATDQVTTVLVGNVVKVVNAAYERGEQGMWKEGFARTNVEEIKELMQHEKLLLGFDASGDLVGCAMCDIQAFDGPVGELGMIAVAENSLGKGFGKQLIETAENLCKSNGCVAIQLELLFPKDFEHPMKKRLNEWYQRLGYVPGQQENFGAQFPHLRPFLACECLFTSYRKALN